VATRAQRGGWVESRADPIAASSCTWGKLAICPTTCPPRLQRTRRRRLMSFPKSPNPGLFDAPGQPARGRGSVISPDNRATVQPLPRRGGGVVLSPPSTVQRCNGRRRRAGGFPGTCVGARQSVHSATGTRAVHWGNVLRHPRPGWDCLALSCRARRARNGGEAFLQRCGRPVSPGRHRSPP
jgi:hypothetical protein